MHRTVACRWPMLCVPVLPANHRAAWAAQVAYTTLDYFVINLEHIDTNEPGGEQKVISHPILQLSLGDSNEIWRSCSIPPARMSKRLLSVSETARGLKRVSFSAPLSKFCN